MKPFDVVCYEGIEALPASYLPLFETAGQQSFFLSHEWFANFERTVLKAPDKARIYGVELAAVPVAALVTRLARRGVGFWTPLRLETLGNYYTSLQGLATAGEPESGIRSIEALADAIGSGNQLWDVLDLQPLDEQGLLYRTLPGLLRRQGFVVQNYFCFGNWYLDVGNRPYADYFAARSSSLRRNIPYYTRKLERNPRSRIEIITGGEHLERALQDYEKVYKSSWKIPEPFPEFIPGLVEAATNRGWLRFGVVYVDGEAAAAQIWIVHAGTASIYKVAYDARFSKLSVGTILTAKMMEHVIDVDRVSVVDYLTGDDEYKEEWMSHRRERRGIVAFNPRRIRGAWQAIRNIGGRALKTAISSRRTGTSDGFDAKQ